MKSKLAVLVGALLLAGSAYAQTNQVLSVNAVGYVKVDLIATNKLHLLANNFEPLNGPIAISNTFASLPPGTSVILWDKAAQAYKPAINRSVFGWPVAGSNQLIRGESIFLRTAGASTNVSTYPVYLMGEVPDSDTAPTSTYASAAGITFVGLPYPVQTWWTNTALSMALPAGSSLYVWDSAAQGYSPSMSKSVFGWSAAAKALVLQPGQGFFVVTTNVVNYSEVKPYTWP
ncbi:MAG: hypothetical protein J5I99_02600 [Verrucomicrobia bacterium]|nr:hypothetical protein [Verrucomicrobiota bacterium]